MSDRLKYFTVDELSAIVFRLDIAETVGGAGRSSRGITRRDGQGVEGAG